MSVRIIQLELPKLLLTKALNVGSMVRYPWEIEEKNFTTTLWKGGSTIMSPVQCQKVLTTMQSWCKTTVVRELLNNGTSNAKQDSKISSSALNQTEKQTIQASKFSTCNHSRWKLSTPAIRLEKQTIQASSFGAFKLCNQSDWKTNLWDSKLSSSTMRMETHWGDHSHRCSSSRRLKKVEADWRDCQT